MSSTYVAKHIRIGSNISAILCVIEDGFQADTAVEGRIANWSNGVADGNACQAATIIEFANAFISVTCALNDRKVTVKILKRSEKMMI